MDNNAYDSLFYFLTTQEAEGAEEIVASTQFQNIIRHKTLKKRFKERLARRRGDLSIIFEIFLSNYFLPSFSIEHAYLTGENRDNIDFMLCDNNTKWLIEAVSIAESKRQKNNTQYNHHGIGSTWTNPVKDAELTQKKVCEKVFQDGCYRKFPIPTANIINIIVVDTKGIGVCKFDKIDAQFIAYGQDPFIGLFENKHHPYSGVEHLRNRIHAIVWMTNTNVYSKNSMFTSGSITVNKLLLNSIGLKELPKPFPIRND